jgi:exopolysaccharide biosynthesis protein
LVVPPIPANVPDIKEAPSSGYRRQKVTVSDVSFLVDIVSADLNHTKVIVDTASDSTCTNNCPVLPLNTYVNRSGAYAGINGTYFCPDTYPSCVDKKNTFDVLVMNKNKVYFNSDNNVYSSVPVAIFSGNSARFISQSSGWGRNTDVDAVIANRPLLVLDGNLMFSSGGEAKEIIKSSRGFLGSSGNIAYIGIVHNATVVESAKVIQTMGIKNAINLDDGGSAALWSGGYKVGPGRNLPNVVLFVSR